MMEVAVGHYITKYKLVFKEVNFEKLLEVYKNETPKIIPHPNQLGKASIEITTTTFRKTMLLYCENAV